MVTRSYTIHCDKCLVGRQGEMDQSLKELRGLLRTEGWLSPLKEDKTSDRCPKCQSKPKFKSEQDTRYPRFKCFECGRVYRFHADTLTDSQWNQIDSEHRMELIFMFCTDEACSAGFLIDKRLQKIKHVEIDLTIP